MAEQLLDGPAVMMDLQWVKGLCAKLTYAIHLRATKQLKQKRGKLLIFILGTSMVLKGEIHHANSLKNTVLILELPAPGP